MALYARAHPSVGDQLDLVVPFELPSWMRAARAEWTTRLAEISALIPEDGFDCAERISFLRGPGATGLPLRLRNVYVQQLGSSLVDAVLLESYMQMVHNIFMRTSNLEASSALATSAALTSEAFMETIALLDDLAAFSITFPRMDTSRTSAPLRRSAATLGLDEAAVRPEAPPRPASVPESQNL